MNCPYLYGKYREDWGLEDPTGESDKEFIKIIRRIEDKVLIDKPAGLAVLCPVGFIVME